MSKKRFVLTVVITFSVLTLALSLAAPNAQAQTTDPCAQGLKSSAAININAGNPQLVIAGKASKRIYVCGVVVTASAANAINISFAAGSSGCSTDLTFFGSVFPTNNVVISAGGGTSTQFTAPTGQDFCIELGGTLPVQANGWVTYVQR
jgi:hypothetical protein